MIELRCSKRFRPGGSQGTGWAMTMRFPLLGSMVQGPARAVRFPLAGILVLGLAVTIGGCMVGPDYKKPPSEMPAQWSEESKGVQVAPLPDISKWWTLFEDQKLNDLIVRAIRANKDLKIAEARIRQARAQRGVTAADLFPTINADGSYVYSQQSLTTTKVPRASAGSTPAATPGGQSTGPTNLFQIGFDASWELDIWGGTRRAVEAADATLASTIEDRRSVLVSLVSDVALNYMQVRGFQLRLAIARDNIHSQQQTLELTQARFEAGLSSELAVAQQKAQLASTEATLPVFETGMRQAIHQLGVLLGGKPEMLLDELLKDEPIPPAPPGVPAGLPSDLLRQRPDIRSAERQLAAATANIGVATAQLFPQFSLTGTVGQQSIFSSKWFMPGSNYFSVGPSVSWAIFDAGRIRWNIKVQDALQEQALYTYEKSILVALQDVEDALVAYAKEQDTRDALRLAVESNQRAYDISYELYSKGLVDFLNVLDAQRNLFLTQDQYAQSTLRVSTDLVALYKALGGGWDVPPPAAIQQVAQKAPASPPGQEKAEGQEKALAEAQAQEKAQAKTGAMPQVQAQGKATAEKGAQAQGQAQGKAMPQANTQAKAQ